MSNDPYDPVPREEQQVGQEVVAWTNRGAGDPDVNVTTIRKITQHSYYVVGEPTQFSRTYSQRLSAGRHTRHCTLRTSVAGRRLLESMVDNQGSSA